MESSPLRLQLRFSDTDKLGHVNNAVFATYAELGRLAFLEELGVSATGLILARLELDFRRQVLLGQSCAVVTRVMSVGRTSFKLSQTITADGEVAAEAVAVVVCFDYGRQTPVPVPPAMRLALGADPTPE